MEWVQIDGTEVPLLEPPQKENETRRWVFHALYVIFKHKLIITKLFFAVSFPLLAIILSGPKEYVAASRVLIKPDRAVLLSPTSEGAWNVSPSVTAVNTEIQIIKSQELLERLAKEVPLSEENAEQNGNANAEEIASNADFTRHAKRLRGRLYVAPVRATNLIEISSTSVNPQWAARLVNRAAELYLEQSLKVNRPQGIEQFYDDQEKKLQSELLKAETALKEFQEREKVLDAEKELGSTMGSLATFETSVRTTESAIREANERIRMLQAQLKEQRENVQAGRSLTTNPMHGKIRDRLVQLELERENLLQRYNPTDRMVMDKEKEITELKARLAKEEKRMLEGESVSLNTIHDGILHALLAAKAELNALEARRATLLKQVGSLSSDAVDLKKKSYTYDRLLQNINANKEALALYKRKAEEARISNAMDERKFGNASVLEKAAPPLPRAGLAPSILIVATLIFSIAIAVGVAFVTEFLSTTLKNEADIEERTGLPVLATIEYYRS
jgi:uncharacterized protein involved in exopolysaccharide biosynthesis